MKTINTILFLLFLTYSAQGQLNSFEIEQRNLPSGGIYSYHYNGTELLVQKGLNKKKRVQKVKLNSGEVFKIDSLINTLRLDTLRETYSTDAFDGTRIDFSFKLKEREYHIHLDNYYLFNLDIFLNQINQFIKPKNRFISFGDQVYLDSDTAIFIYPDFFLTVQKPNSNYNEPSIQCFKKGRLYREVLDSVFFCQCVIYALNDKRNEYPRLDPWRANKIDNFSWELIYYDSNKTVLNSEKRKAVLPLNYVKERIVKHPGTRPSIYIYRYYETSVTE